MSNFKTIFILTIFTIMNLIPGIMSILLFDFGYHDYWWQIGRAGIGFFTLGFVVVTRKWTSLARLIIFSVLIVICTGNDFIEEVKWN